MNQTRLPDLELPPVSSLQGIALKRMAQKWKYSVVRERYHLAALPVKLKEALLHNIARHSPYGITADHLNVLFCCEEELEGATGTEGLTKVDLSGSIGVGLSMGELEGFFKTPEPDSSPSKKGTDDVPEAWDTQPSPGLRSPKFSNVTHLSLAIPHLKSDLWVPLLNVAKYLGCITHLSLAYWPKPNTYEKLNTSSFSTPRGDVQAGPTGYYDNYDGDFSGPAHELKMLSKELSRLKWLDLTGSYPWIHCLRYMEEVLSGRWLALHTIIIDQGCCPKPIDAIAEKGDTWGSAVEKFYKVGDSSTEARNQRKVFMTWLHVEAALRVLAFDIHDLLERKTKEGEERTKATLSNERRTKLNLVYASKDPFKAKFVDFARFEVERLADVACCLSHLPPRRTLTALDSPVRVPFSDLRSLPYWSLSPSDDRDFPQDGGCG